MPYDPLNAVGYEPKQFPKQLSESKLDQDLTTDGSSTEVSITIPRNGTLLSFLATADCQGNPNGVGVSTRAKAILTKNDVTLSSASITDESSPFEGVFFTETLGFLTNSEVFLNDVFKLKITKTGGTGTFGFNLSISALILEK